MRAVITVVLLVLASQDAPRRQPPPMPPAIKEAEKSVRDLFKDDYAKKSTADRLALARTLLESGEKTADQVAVQWVLITEARDLAAQSGDLDLAFQAVDALGRRFLVKTALLKLELLSKQPKPTADAALAIVEDGIRTNDYDAALKAADLGRKLAAADAALAARITARGKEAADLKARYAKAAKAFETLDKNPEDPAANQEVGEFGCLVKGDWEQGLPHLARGPESPLSALAKRDLAGAESAADQAALGDAWWELGEKQKGEAKTRYFDRAAEWYGRALGGLQGIEKVKLEKRLGSLPPSKAPVNLLRRADPAQDVVQGGWTAKDGGLLSDTFEFGTLQLPYVPPAEYDFRVTFIRQEGMAEIVLFFSQGARTVCWAQNTADGWGSVKGLWNQSNPTQSPSPVTIVNGRPYTLVAEVRKDRFRILIEGKLVKDWKTNWDDAGLPSFLKLKSPGVAICSYKSPTLFTRVEVVEVSGRGRPSR